MKTISAPYLDESMFYGKFWNFKIFRKILVKSEIIRDFFTRRAVKSLIYKYEPRFAIIGGGELISSHVGFNTAMKNWANELSRSNVDFYITGVSGDTQMSKKMLKNYNSALHKARLVFVRDNKTRQILKDVYDIETECYPDVVFSLGPQQIKPNQKRKQIMLIPITPNKRNLKGLKLKNQKEYLLYLKSTIEDVLGAQKVKIASTVKTDDAFCRRLYLYLKKTAKYDLDIMEYSSLHNFMDQLKETELTISARMHGMILALLAGSSIHAIKFKQKLSVFADEYGSNNNVSLISGESRKQFELIYEDMISKMA